jgi:translation initiation factor IF-3
VPVPRKFDRRPPERDTTRINDRIRVPEVRLVGEDGKQIGVIKTSEALAYAQERDLDLVEVAPDARPPVCRVLDYSKFKYEQAQKQKAARRHQQQITIREIKFRPKIAQNDYDTKKGHVSRFLLGKDKVKITIMFRGREVTHPERGTALLDKLATELGDIAVIEQTPLQDGRNMTMMLAPSKAVLAGERDKAGNHVVAPAETANGTQPDGEAREETAAEDTSAPATTATQAYEKTSGPAAAAAQEREAAPAPAAEASEEPPAPAPEASEDPAPEASEEPPAPAPRATEPREQTPAPAPEPSDAIA